MANKAIKYRLYPTEEQAVFFAKTFGCCRKVYNLMLADKIACYKETKSFGRQTPAMYKKDYPFLKYEWTSIMLNINEGYNRELMEKCRMLRDYAGFVALIRENALEYPTDEAIDQAVQEYIARGGEFAEFLLMHRSEVVDMCITEYDETLHEQNLLEEGKREGFAEGRKNGLAEGRILSIKNLMSTAGYSVDEAMRLLLIPEDDKEKYRVIILKNNID